MRAQHVLSYKQVLMIYTNRGQGGKILYLFINFWSKYYYYHSSFIQKAVLQFRRQIVAFAIFDRASSGWFVASSDWFVASSDWFEGSRGGFVASRDWFVASNGWFLDFLWFLSYMVLLLDSDSEIGATVSSNIWYLICVRHFIRSRTVTNSFFSKKTHFLACVRNTI